MSTPFGFEPRAMCSRCRRPESVCYCRHLTSLETTTRIILLQHPRERDVAIGTARMASLCLPNAELHVGVHFRDSAPLRRALSDAARPAALLYPGEGAIDIEKHPPKRPITLIVVDGTWWQAKKVIRENPELAALPRYAFTPKAPSEYRIRREPDPSYVSTIEALMHVLGALEGDPARFRALLEPFRAMIDAQIECEKRLSSGRVRHPRPAPKKLRGVPRLFRERDGHLLCVVGEANAWPYREREMSYPDELVHWVAYRLGTGETFELRIAPRQPLAPRTPQHIGLSADELAAGTTMTELIEQWRSFVRESDTICSWGRYATALFAASGGYLPSARVDLRQTARVFAQRKVGTLEEFAASIGFRSSPALAGGRAGQRLLQVANIARFFSADAATKVDDETNAAS